MGFTDHRSTAAGAGRYAIDLLERVAATFVQAFLGALVAGGWFDIDGIRDMSIVQTAGVAGIVAVLAVVKGVVAKFVSDRNSASLASGV